MLFKSGIQRHMTINELIKNINMTFVKGITLFQLFMFDNNTDVVNTIMKMQQT